MITFFISLVLIAEIIITYQIVSFIMKIDKQVCELNERVTLLTPVIEEKFTAIRIALNKILLKLNKFEQKLRSKKEEYKFIILKNVVTIALFLVLNTNFKKILSAIDLAFAFKDFIKECAKSIA